MIHLLRSVRFLFLPLLCILAGAAQAQHDVILRMDGREHKARVLLVRPDHIGYLPQDTATTDTLQIATAQVFMIRYANGAKEMISHPPQAAPRLSATEAYRLGRQDAQRYYKAPGAFWGTYGATVAYFPAGIVTGTVVAVSTPSPVVL